MLSAIKETDSQQEGKDWGHTERQHLRKKKKS